MVIKTRLKSEELIILEFLNKRMTLPDKDKQHYINLKKGYEGEVMFDLLTEKLQCECYILNDLLFKVNNTLFQIDTLIIFPGSICLYEVKNLEGDYVYERDRLLTKAKTEISNPLHQLNRSESLLRQLLHKLGIQLSMESWVIFINPGFTLYQAPLNVPFMFPTQLQRYLEKLDQIPSKLNGKDKNLAEKLISLHIDKSPYTRLPVYDYQMLQKGITCAKCDSFSVVVKGKTCICSACGHEEMVGSAVLRNVKEYMILFPERKITTNTIYDWCRIVDSKKRISRILEREFEIVGSHQWSFYEPIR